MTMSNRIAILDDLYQIVHASNSRRRDELLELISDLIELESDRLD